VANPNFLGLMRRNPKDQLEVLVVLLVLEGPRVLLLGALPPIDEPKQLEQLEQLVVLLLVEQVADIPQLEGTATNTQSSCSTSTPRQCSI